MNTERCLFVGGPEHLSEREVRTEDTYVEILRRPEGLTNYRTERQSNMVIDCKISIYRKVGKAAGLIIMEYVK
jgi:hypothetical protein